MTERNKTTKAQLAQDKSQDRIQEKVQQRYFSELAKYHEQIRKTQASAGKGRTA